MQQLKPHERGLIEDRLIMHQAIQREETKKKKGERHHYEERFQRINTLKRWLSEDGQAQQGKAAKLN